MAFSSRQLWQVPTFLLGAAALAAVWFGKPYLLPSTEQIYERDLTSLRQALDKSPVDAAQVQTLLRKVHGIEPPPRLKKDAMYVVGSAIVILAETSTIPEEAAEQWRMARELLEAAQAQGVAEDDKARLQFRLAKTWARTGEPPRKIIDALNASLRCGDDPADGCRVLAELYLKLQPPETRNARDKLKEYLANVLPARTEAQQRQLNQARLSLGELQIQLRETEEARKLLERIGPDSPAEILVAARVLLARSYLDDEEWKQAIRCLEQARDVRGITAAQKTYVLYQLAEALLRAKRKGEAIAALEQLRRGSGPEALAAAFRLVGLNLNDPNKRDDAVDALEKAAGEIGMTEHYDNQLLPIGEARDLFEEAAQKLRAANEFDLSLRVARAFGVIAEAGRDHELAAEALQAWGQLLLDRALLASPEERPRLVEEGTKRLREAALEWHEVAKFKKSSAEKGEPLYRAAELYHKAGDFEAALNAFDELNLTVPDFPRERLADVWLNKGEVYLARNNREQARLCFVNGVKTGEAHPTLALVKCRIHLAEILLRNDDVTALTAVIAELENDLANPELNKDKRLTDDANLFIAEVFFTLKSYSKAEVKLRSLLNASPDGAQALKARFRLGECYYFIASQESEKCKVALKVKEDPTAPSSRLIEAASQYEASHKLYLEWLRKASEPFQEVETGILKIDVSRRSPVDADLLRRASFYAADCAFYTGDNSCISRYDAIAERYAGKIAQLDALKRLWRCFQYYEQDGKKAVDTLVRLRTAYTAMPDTEFDGSEENRRRDYWERWFAQVMPMPR
jgi:tetratricopeptide (TPR) repeat protein